MHTTLICSPLSDMFSNFFQKFTFLLANYLAYQLC